MSMSKSTQALASSMAQVIALSENDEMIRVLAADSHRMNNQSLAAALERDNGFQVLDPVSDPRAILGVVAREKPAVVVVSAELDDNPRKGFEVARELHALRSETRVVMLLDTPERTQVGESFRAGARGVFSRTDSLKSLAKCRSEERRVGKECRS